MYLREESEYYRAKQKAAHRICQGWIKPADLPSNAEIRDEIQTFARLHEGDARTNNLRDMRIEGKRIVVDLLRHAAPDAAPEPAQVAYELGRGELVKVGAAQGR